eukprot:scaffold55025_cov57-Phaeocystis_antarctica.AAC.1
MVKAAETTTTATSTTTSAASTTPATTATTAATTTTTVGGFKFRRLSYQADGYLAPLEVACLRVRRKLAIVVKDLRPREMSTQSTQRDLDRAMWEAARSGNMAAVQALKGKGVNPQWFNPWEPPGRGMQFNALHMASGA